jgi:hypothetical protein
MEAVKQQKEDETILEKICMNDDCVDFEEGGDLDIWEQENEINSHNPDQYLPEYMQHINGMERWLALDLSRRYTEDDPLDSEDGGVLFCMEK